MGYDAKRLFSFKIRPCFQWPARALFGTEGRPRAAALALNSNASGHCNTGNAGKGNCRSNKTADCLAAPKTGGPTRHRPNRRRLLPEARQREARFRHQRLRRLSRLANWQAQSPRAQPTQMRRARASAKVLERKSRYSGKKFSALTAPSRARGRGPRTSKAQTDNVAEACLFSPSLTV
jgi:hypothetical protein